MGKSKHGKKHFMEGGKSNKKGFKRPSQDAAQDDWRQKIRQMPEQDGV